MKRKPRPELPPFRERVDVDRLGDVLVLRPVENGIITLARDDIRALARVLADPRGGR